MEVVQSDGDLRKLVGNAAKQNEVKQQGDEGKQSDPYQRMNLFHHQARHQKCNNTHASAVFQETKRHLPALCGFHLRVFPYHALIIWSLAPYSVPQRREKRSPKRVRLSTETKFRPLLDVITHTLCKNSNLTKNEEKSDEQDSIDRSPASGVAYHDCKRTGR